MTARLRLWVPAIFGVLVVVTVLAGTVPTLGFAHRSITAHVAIETAAAIVTLLATFILFGRYRETLERTDFLLFVGLLLLFAANLARWVAPSYTGENEAVVWVPLSAGLFASAVLTVAAFTSGGEVTRAVAQRLVLAALVAVGALMAAVALVSDLLATGIDPGISPADRDSPRVVGTPGLLGAQLASMALFAAAALGFGRRAERRRDEFLAWLAAGMALAALARFSYFLFPSIYSDWVFTGDLLRFAAQLAILTGALRQVAAYQRAAATVAVVEERSRIAGDLHDGLAQDLAFIAMQSDAIARTDERAVELAEAARHALAESRGAIENLRLTDAPVGPALTSVARGLANRHRAGLRLEIDDSVEVPPHVRDQLLRIAGEAISNAVRHGDPSQIEVTLRRHRGRVHLVVADDGRGFDPGAVVEREGEGGLGLPGIRRRAERLGGACRIRSRPGKGATVEVVVP
ncbi:MAG TPA: ATP-binding protein [Solirubrobacterales bacterium]|nr:ATP-binding protein [Solirubrobacterales bacterium]